MKRISRDKKFYWTFVQHCSPERGERDPKCDNQSCRMSPIPQIYISYLSVFSVLIIWHSANLVAIVYENYSIWSYIEFIVHHHRQYVPFLWNSFNVFLKNEKSDVICPPVQRSMSECSQLSLLFGLSKSPTLWPPLPHFSKIWNEFGERIFWWSISW